MTTPTKAEITKPKRSRRTAISRFLNLLTFLDSDGPIQSLNKTNTENDHDVRLLFNEGLISGDEMNAASGYQLLNAAITPKGAVAIHEWQAIISQSSFKTKIMYAITAIASSIGTLLVQYAGPARLTG